jgi:ribonuclease R
MLPEGITMSYGGLDAVNQDNMGGIIIGLIAAITIVFFFLLFNFKKIRLTLLSLCGTGLCLLGGFVGLWIFGADVSLTAIIGIVSLIGINVRNTIVMFDYAEELRTLDRLAKKLREKRFKGGAVKFDREELHFDVDEKGKPIRAYFKKSNDATQLIEEFMLLANKTVAESIGRVKKGAKAKTLPYRVHDQPDPQKLENLRQFVSKFGYKVKTSGTKGAITKSLNSLMADAEGTREQNAIETVALRAMMKAKYSVHNIGHYGLAFDYYTHFTSPIRRYPDMMVHRLLTKYQDGARSANKDKYEEFCEHCSDMEQISQNAERDSIKYKMVEFMEDKIGNTYDAHISGLTSYGIYAQIDENHCEGMIPIRDLGNDYYDFDEKNFVIVGRRNHTKYQLGDPIRIQVARANVERKQLDFTLAED